MINTIILGHALNILPQLPAGSVNCVVTSPPYFELRDYSIEPVIWDGDKNCKHEWGNKTITLKHKSGETNPGKESWFKDKGASDDKGNCFCIKCGAWKGSLGLEPTIGLYIKHLCNIFDEVKRVLRKDGTCWVNIGDSYGGTQGKNAGWPDSKTRAKVPQQLKPKQYAKCLLDIPYRFSIEMTNRGWIKRNTIIWWKPNCMPSSAPDRFTIDFEYLFSFVKNNKTLFWTNEKTLECIDKKSLGTKGIEGKDWEWRLCPACSDKNYFNIRTRDVMKKQKDCPQFKASDKEKENIKNKICPRCKGLRKVKYSFWTGHDYWFEQQFEGLQGNEYDINRMRTKPNYNNKTNQTAVIGRATSKNIEQGRNKRCVWIDDSNYEIIVNNVNGENIFKAGNIPYAEIAKCFGHWFSDKQKTKGTTWKIPTQPFPEAHFAVYPEGLIEIPIKAGCPEFVCKKCGKARVKIYKEATGGTKGHSWHDHSADMEKGNVKKQTGSEYNTYKRGNFIGYSDCGCDHSNGWDSGIVLDPFIGSGTTALVALKQRKRFIGIEIKQEYIDMSYRKITKVQQEIF